MILHGLIVLWCIISVYRFNVTLNKVTVEGRKEDLMFNIVIISYMFLNVFMVIFFIYDFICHFFNYNLHLF